MVSGAPLRPMSEAPLVPILAVHFERGPIEVRPCHEWNYWLPERGWVLIEDPEVPTLSECEFDGWIAECA
jgi:hypothetical protein